ncbi:DUF262 domain-containing protein [Candidatus Marithrix sp. Canyon 246]|uniref:DUF262 domain-containing protein n=1 Tax=Candidatus Marithrix sp. Canyon 246 TaxID=1827136 RepID=UPI000A9AC609|nr:DUF262 domain-containing protein [Candidatus Marithrix sp. Canyon 246]
MYKFMLMEPTNQTFQELVANGIKYTIPRFQRDYAWDQEQWEDLWADIETLKDEHYHYMGYIVLQQKGQYDFTVIDGQQRLVTLSLIILAAMRSIQDNDEKNKERLREITARFIGSKDLVSLKVSSKLSLNRNNNRFYREICSLLKSPNPRGLIASNKLLKNAFEFFLSKSIGITGTEIAAFIERLTSGMVFTKIVVQDDLNAYKIFETLNSRGVQLSIPDLLKNHIFSIITTNDDIIDERLDDLDEEWSAIVSQIGENNFTYFIYCHHNFKNNSSKKELFIALRQLINTPEAAYAYLRSLTEYAPIYASLLNHHDEWWASQKDDYRAVRKYLEALNLFNIKQAFIVLMVAFTKFSCKEFIKLARYIYVLSIRYNVICHNSPNEQENLYKQIAQKIFNKDYARASHVKNGEEFRKLYPENNAFFNAFEFHKIPSRQYSKKIRFLLAEIETYLDHKVDYTKTSLEHICPYHPEQTWYEYFGEGVKDIKDRLGNMVLLGKDELKRSSFKDKTDFYLNTPFALAKKIAEYKEWNLQNLNDYQAWLAEQAVNTWRL